MINKVLYCGQCGFVFGDEFNIPKKIQKGICPICNGLLKQSKEDIDYFKGRVENTMPTWKDVVRNKYLNKSKINKTSYIQREQIEVKENIKNINALKHIKDVPSKPIVHCPYCNSTDTKKITNTSKAVHTALFGLFSISRNSKQWHCNKCRSDF